MNRYLAFLLLLLIVACRSTPDNNTLSTIKFRGETMGTYYSVIYKDVQNANHQAAIDSLLKEINAELSTYIPTSTISSFNTGEDGVIVNQGTKKHFKMVFDRSKEIYEDSEGAFDPTVMPLVNYWGFGYTKKEPKAKDEMAVDSLLQLVGFDKVDILELDGGAEIQYQKNEPQMQLDFSAIAKGYGVDQVGELLERRGVKHYLVEIGGELRARGKSKPDKHWTVGINTPKEGAKTQDVHTVVQLKEIAIASSGNYRNYYEENGVKYAHTINPKTGKPELSRLLSASVFATDCMTADAFATACMVLGLERADSLISGNDGLEAFFIYSDEKGELQTKASAGMSHYLLPGEVE